jgi:hypothetical protein
MTLLLATTYLAGKPTGAVLACLVVAIVLFAVCAALALLDRLFWATALAVGFAFLILAFVV